MKLAQIKEALQKECQVTVNERLVVGVSGGPDSICLLDSLHRLGIPLLAAHFDHGLRDDSAEDAHRVEAQVREMGVPFRQARQDVRALAVKEGLSIEEAARKARYRFLFEMARANQAQAVAVAHTADDQVETVLMHLLRGSGLGGLKGMVSRLVIAEWDAEIPLVRPLLGFWRSEIVEWCTENGLPVLNDPSNQDTVFFRNRLRHELIPTLQTYNPNIKDVLWRMAYLLGGDWELVEGLGDQACQDCQVEKQGDRVTINLAKLQTLASGLQRIVFRRAMAQMRAGLRDIDASSIERCLVWLKKPARGRWLEVGAGLYLGAEWGRIILSETPEIPLADDWPQVRAGEEIVLAVPGEAVLGKHWLIRAKWLPEGGNYPAADFFQASQGVGLLVLAAQMDADKLTLPLVVRGFHAGERLAPLGMAGHSLKLSDYFTNRKLPQRARSGWPLVTSGGETAWVCGLSMSDKFKVDSQTRRVVRLELVQRVSEVSDEFSG